MRVWQTLTLSSMALLSLTKAQLGVTRSKQFKVNSLMAMDRLLTLRDSGTDSLILRLSCTHPDGGADIVRNYYFNDIPRNKIGEPVCPAKDASTANTYPVFDSLLVDGESEVNNPPVADCDSELDNFDALAGSSWTEKGAITCGAGKTLSMKLYDARRPEVSMTYNLLDYMYACLENDNLKVVYEFGKREFFEGKELCFDNNFAKYKNDYRGGDFPYTIHNNCYAFSYNKGSVSNYHLPEDTNQDLTSPFFFNCHQKGYLMDLNVRDLKESNLAEGVAWPMRLPKMYVQLSFDKVKDFFQIFPEDRVRMSFYMEGEGNPRSVSISWDDEGNTEPVCEPERIADEVKCDNTEIFCMSPADHAILRVVAAGKILFHRVSCATLIAAGSLNEGGNSNSWTALEAQLAGDETQKSSFDAIAMGSYTYNVPNPVGVNTGATITYKVGHNIRSQEPICFSGDYLPFNGPSCELHDNAKSDTAVPTRIHAPHEYAMGFALVELKVNEEYIPAHTNAPKEYSIGGEVALNEAMQEVVRGYLNLGDLQKAVPASAEVVSEPRCGVLLREKAAVGEQSIALFWTVTAAGVATSELHVGDVVNLADEAVLFQGAVDGGDCEDLQQQFKLKIGAEYPVTAPVTTQPIVPNQGGGRAHTSGLINVKLSQV